MSSITSIVCVAIGLGALVTGAVAACCPADPSDIPISQVAADRLQRLADANCRCYRSGRRDCPENYDSQLTGVSATACAPVSTISRSYGDHEIIIWREFVGTSKRVFLCSNDEAAAAEKAFYRAWSIANSAGGDLKAQRYLDQAADDIVCGKPVAKANGPAGCGP